MARKKHGYEPDYSPAPTDAGIDEPPTALGLPTAPETGTETETETETEAEVVRVVAGGKTYLLARGTIAMTPTAENPGCSTDADSLLPDMVVVDGASGEKLTVSDVCLVTGRATGGLSVWTGPLR